MTRAADQRAGVDGADVVTVAGDHTAAGDPAQPRERLVADVFSLGEQDCHDLELTRREEPIPQRLLDRHRIDRGNTRVFSNELVKHRLTGIDPGVPVGGSEPEVEYPA